jgi:hypothetical protein
MSDEILEKTTDAPENTQEQSTPKNVLFGAISYNDDTAYENFIQGMDLNQAIFVLVASSNYAQSKGAYNLLESETISSAIRAIRKKSGDATEPTKDEE